MQHPSSTVSQIPFSLGAWRVEPASRELRQGDTCRRLSPKALQVLLQLAEAEGRVLTREDLLDRVWPNVVVGEEVLTHAVAELRRALGDPARRPRYVETVHKAGYRLLQPVVMEQPWDARAPNHALIGPETITPISPSAYLQYLEAGERHRRGGRTNLTTAATLYATVVESAPDFVHARVGLAETLAFLSMYYLPGDEHLRRAEDLALDAVRRVPALARGHAVLGLTLAATGRYRHALERFGTALAVDPKCFESHYLFGRAAFAERDYATAAPLLAQAGRIGHGDFHMLYLAAKAYRGLGDAERARRLCQQALFDAERYLILNPDDLRATCDRICCLVELGEIERAQDLADAVADTDDPMAYYLACSLARAGETDWALDCLETVVQGGWSHAGWLRADPDLDRLREQRRFRVIQHQLEAG